MMIVVVVLLMMMVMLMPLGFVERIEALGLYYVSKDSAANARHDLLCLGMSDVFAPLLLVAMVDFHSPIGGSAGNEFMGELGMVVMVVCHCEVERKVVVNDGMNGRLLEQPFYLRRNQCHAAA